MTNSGNSHASAMLQEAASRFLSDGAPENVVVALAPDLQEQLRALAEENGVGQEEAIRMALAAGLARLDAVTDLAAQGRGLRDAEYIEWLKARVMMLETNYAVMKHRLWLALQDNQVMSLRDGALKAALTGQGVLIEDLRRDLEVARSGAVEPLHGAGVRPASPEVTRREVWQERLRRLLQRRA